MNAEGPARRTSPETHRRVRSFVRRGGRVTPGQQRALDSLWPDYGLDPATPLEPVQAFARDAPRVLEIGFGAGESLLAQAIAHPEHDHIGVEVYRAGVGRLLREASHQRLTNLRVYLADAVEVLDQCVPAGSLAAVQLFFPDPWPKKRHHKRRIVQPEFADRVVRCLKPGGRWLLATDWAPYAAHMLDALNAHPELRNAATDGGYVPAPPERVHTRFEQRGEKLGHQMFDLVFIRQQPSAP